MIIVTLSRLTLQLERMRISVGELAVSMELLSPGNTGGRNAFNLNGFGGNKEVEQQGHEQGSKSFMRGTSSEQSRKRHFGGRHPSDLSQTYVVQPGDEESVDSPPKESYMLRW